MSAPGQLEECPWAVWRVCEDQQIRPGIASLLVLCHTVSGVIRRERKEEKTVGGGITSQPLDRQSAKQKLHFKKLPIVPIEVMCSWVVVLLSPSGENQVFYTLLMCSYDVFLYSKRHKHHARGLLIWICSAGMTVSEKQIQTALKFSLIIPRDQCWLEAGRCSGQWFWGGWGEHKATNELAEDQYWLFAVVPICYFISSTRQKWTHAEHSHMLCRETHSETFSATVFQL